jgi:hypothetical protein
MRIPKWVPVRYIPKVLSGPDSRTVKREIALSRRMYRRGIYHTRRNVKTFRSKKSSHVIRAKRVYGIDRVVPSRLLANKTGCSIQSLSKIERKGQGAYFSSGSRPNQTAHSWGRARLASAVTGGKSAAVDFSILDQGCNHATSKAYKMALTAVKKYGHGQGHTRRVRLAR